MEPSNSEPMNPLTDNYENHVIVDGLTTATSIDDCLLRNEPSNGLPNYETAQYLSTTQLLDDQIVPSYSEIKVKETSRHT
jgi:hypothetical protein